ncbi:hypothetical protein J1N35_003707 [Gossypium stocksii]|uniref:Uncharacterized protein n=1 Tax=Gossypium stocksii TaxID=47602 RepID=A0A9D3WBE3_9ROSI|nr:hypothetical protein J1N35_003707 [Gossypium stocksii]
MHCCNHCRLKAQVTLPFSDAIAAGHKKWHNLPLKLTKQKRLDPWIFSVNATLNVQDMDIGKSLVADDELQRHFHLTHCPQYCRTDHTSIFGLIDSTDERQLIYD